MNAFQRRRRLARQCFEEVDLLRIVKTVRLPGFDTNHADQASRRSERQVESVGARQRAGSRARFLAVVIDPLGHAQVAVRRTVGAHRGRSVY